MNLKALLTVCTFGAAVSTALADIGRARVVPDAYIEAQTGRAAIETREVYELANILLMLADTPPADGLVLHGTDYAAEIEAWFGPFRDHPAVAAAAFSAPSQYQRFRDNAFRYCFDADGGLIECVPMGFLWDDAAADRFTPHLTAIADFAEKGDFRAFYAAHAGFYAAETAAYAANADIRDMQAWLEANFAARVTSYIVAISPLIDGFHATDSYKSVDGAFTEAVMFTSSPIRFREMDSEERAIREARTVFTEIDHNYVNPVSATYSARIEVVTGAFWVRTWPVPGYESGEAVFNEYMTWGVFLLYAQDRYDEARFSKARAQLTSFMEGKRGFVRFGAFADALLSARAASRNAQAETLYPAMLDWMAAYAAEGGR